VTLGISNKCTCDGNIKMVLRDMGLEGVDWIHLAQDMVR
jgi:hypothetical protein